MRSGIGMLLLNLSCETVCSIRNVLYFLCLLRNTVIYLVKFDTELDDHLNTYTVRILFPLYLHVGTLHFN